MRNFEKMKPVLKSVIALLGLGWMLGHSLPVQAKISEAELNTLTSNVNADFVDWTDNGVAWTTNVEVPEGSRYSYIYYEKNVGQNWPVCWYGQLQFTDLDTLSGLNANLEKAGLINFPDLKLPKEIPSYPELSVTTGVDTSFSEAGTGQHLYTYERWGLIPIYKWTVQHERGTCMHWDSFVDSYYGLPCEFDFCKGSYYSGWYGYCADCGEYLADYLIYMDYDSLSQLQAVDNRYEYFYRCHCTHLEQAPGKRVHYCKDVSYNQYKVMYDGNHPAATGLVNVTLHMYNNATTYRGKDVSNLCTRYLSDNTNGRGFEMKGYKVIGWDKAPGDPYGTPDYDLGEEILNLTADDWNVGDETGTGAGVITLYAVWGEVEGTLTVAPGTEQDVEKGAVYNDGSAAGASYDAVSGSTSITLKYNESYTIDFSKLTAPTLGTVTFNSMGGEAVEPITVQKELASWQKTLDADGRFLGTFLPALGKYAYTYGVNGGKATLTAIWKADSITLPDATKDGYSFCGWYLDEECNKPVGSAGATYTPSGDVTLYAGWSNLVLESKTDLSVDGGKGGVDLSWRDGDSLQKVYRIYQKREDATDWSRIYSADEVGSQVYWDDGSQTVTTPGTGYLEVPATGFYTFEAYGAQGSDYGTNTGGLGGYAGGTWYLNKGDIISYNVGSRTDGGSGGIGGDGASGGGLTRVEILDSSYGFKETLLIAGGGGGASAYLNGGGGGESSGLRPDSGEGGDGAAGGGDGYFGGVGATTVLHTHDESCYISASNVAGGVFYNTAVLNSSTTHSPTLTPSGTGVTAQVHTMDAQSFYDVQVGSSSSCLDTPKTGTLSFNISVYDWGEANVSYDDIGRILDVYAADGTLLKQWDLTAIGTVTSANLPLCSACGEYYTEYTRTVSTGEISGTAIYHGTYGPHTCEDGYKLVNGLWSGDFTVTIPIEEAVEGIYLIYHGSMSTSTDVGSWLQVEISGLRYDYTYLSCSKTDTHTPAYGGASYISDTRTWAESWPAFRAGDGGFKVTVGSVGYLNVYALADVSANDVDSPFAVDTAADKVKFEAADETSVNVSFEAPEDKGTIYYHYAESILVSDLATDPDKVWDTSEPTVNEIKTGVAKYYYVLDTNASTVVGSGNMSESTSCTEPSVKVQIQEYKQWLHIAAIDVAGNLGATAHIEIEAKSIINVQWPVITKQVGVSSIVNGYDYESTYHKAANTYYVRADGITPFRLGFESQMLGNARADYQIDYQMFEFSVESFYQEFTTVLPLSDVSMVSGVDLDAVGRYNNGTSILIDAGFYAAERWSYATENAFAQAFSGALLINGTSSNGKVVTVTPRAGASFINEDGMEDVKWSDEAADAANAAVLILDGVGPVISGMEPMQMGEVDLSGGDIELDIFAVDDLSGFKSLSVTVTATDDGAQMVQEYSQDADGHVHLTLSETNALYRGTFQIEVTAIDNVGNVTQEVYDASQLALDTSVIRMWAPHDPIFERGQSGILTIESWGYMERIEVDFPDILNDYDTVYEYSAPTYKGEESIQFMIPLYVENDGAYEIIIRGYKGSRELVCTETIEIYGTLLDNLRWRLR